MKNGSESSSINFSLFCGSLDQKYLKLNFASVIAKAKNRTKREDFSPSLSQSLIRLKFFYHDLIFSKFLEE